MKDKKSEQSFLWKACLEIFQVMMNAQHSQERDCNMRRKSN